VAVRAGDAVAQAFEQLGFERRARRRQLQQALAPVARADGLLDQSAQLEIAEDAAQRLFGDVEQGKQVADCQTRPARDEVQRAVMRAAKPLCGQVDVGPFDHVAVAEVEQLDSPPDLGLAQELRRCCGSGRPYEAKSIYVSHVDAFAIECYAPQPIVELK